MITHCDPDGPLFLFPIEDVVDHEVKVLDFVDKSEIGAGSHPTVRPTCVRLKAIETETHIQELVNNLVSFRSSMSRLGCVFIDYATRPDLWFATMCFENWLALNSCVLRGSWVCPSETRDGLRDFLTRKGLSCRTSDVLARNRNSHIQVEESVHQIFRRAEIERQHFEIAYSSLQNLDDSGTIEISNSRCFCHSICHLPHLNSSEQYSCLELRSCSEPIHILGSLDRIGSFLHHIVEAGKNDPDMMSNFKDRFDTSSCRSNRLKRHLAQLEAFRHLINKENSYDEPISAKIDELKEKRKDEECLRRELISRLLGGTKTSFEEFEDIFGTNESHRRRDVISLDL